MRLLRRFYADVRQHDKIGPIFAEHIEDWPAHLKKIAGFWSGLTGGSSRKGSGAPARDRECFGFPPTASSF